MRKNLTHLLLQEEAWPSILDLEDKRCIFNNLPSSQGECVVHFQVYHDHVDMLFFQLLNKADSLPLQILCILSIRVIRNEIYFCPSWPLDASDFCTSAPPVDVYFFTACRA